MKKSILQIMKGITLFSLFCFCTSKGLHAAHHHHKQPSSSSSASSSSSSSNSNHVLLCDADEYIGITEEAVNLASAQSTDGYVIDVPGHYVLCSDVNWNNTQPNSFAITIIAENVTLDLGGKTLKQANTDQFPQNATNVGIQVAGSAKNIIIQNGIIQSISGAGIVVQQPVVGIIIQDLEINNTGYNGPLLVERTPGFRTLWGFGIFFNGTGVIGNLTTSINDIVIRNCIFNGIGGLGKNSDGTPIQFIPNFDPVTNQFSGDTGAIWGNNCNNVTVDNVIVNDSFGDHQVFCITFLGNYGVIKNTVCNRVLSHGLNKGLLISVSKGWVCEDNAVNGLTCEYVRDSVNGAPTDPTGNDGNVGSEGIKLFRCQDCIVRRLQVTDVIGRTNTTISPVGFDIGNPEVCGIADHRTINNIYEDVVVINCVNDGGLKPTNSPFCWTSGADSLASEQTIYRNCQFLSISSGMGFLAGFFNSFGTATVVGPKNMVIENCGIRNIFALGTPNPSIATAAGIINRRTSGGQFINNTIDNITNTGSVGYGIYFEGPNTANAIVSSNMITRSQTSGIADFALSLTNTYSGNYAAFNGPGGTTNFIPSTLTPGTPIQNWTFGSLPGPAIAGAVLDNINLHN